MQKFASAACLMILLRSAKHSRVQKIAHDALDEFLKIYGAAERWEEVNAHRQTQSVRARVRAHARARVLCKQFRRR